MLTASAVANAKPEAKACKLTDGRGLYLLVKPNGAKWWRFDYRRPVTKKRNTLSMGTYPDVSLKQARERREAARKLLAEGIDPGDQRKATQEVPDRKQRGKNGRFAAGNDGRPTGAKNKVSSELKEMILKALDGAGGVQYLQKQANENPTAFLTLVGKVLPHTLANADGSNLQAPGFVLMPTVPRDDDARS